MAMNLKEKKAAAKAKRENINNEWLSMAAIIESWRRKYQLA